MSLISDFHKEKDEVLITFDGVKIKNFMEKHSIPVPPDYIFWISVHKLITASTNIDLKAKQKSKEWLKKRGFSSYE